MGLSNWDIRGRSELPGDAPHRSDDFSRLAYTTTKVVTTRVFLIVNYTCDGGIVQRPLIRERTSGRAVAYAATRSPSIASTSAVVRRMASGIRLMESMPCSTRKAANSG